MFKNSQYINNYEQILFDSEKNILEKSEIAFGENKEVSFLYRDFLHKKIRSLIIDVFGHTRYLFKSENEWNDILKEGVNYCIQNIKDDIWLSADKWIEFLYEYSKKNKKQYLLLIADYSLYSWIRTAIFKDISFQFSIEKNEYISGWIESYYDLPKLDKIINKFENVIDSNVFLNENYFSEESLFDNYQSINEIDFRVKNNVFFIIIKSKKQNIKSHFGLSYVFSVNSYDFLKNGNYPKKIHNDILSRLV